MVKRGKIESFVDLIIIESSESVKSSSPTFTDLVDGATSSADLSAAERHDLAILREDHKELLRTYRERTDALKTLDLFVLTSVDRTNLLYLRSKTTVFQKLLALKKRLAPTDRIRELEIVRRYKDLLRAPKHQQLDHWLLDWEKVYAEAVRLDISDVQGHRCLYDFLNALRTVDVAFVAGREAILNYEVQQGKTPSFILDLLEEFRNHLRTVKALSNQAGHTGKEANHSAFATFQGQGTEPADQKSSHKCSDSCEHSGSGSGESNLTVIGPSGKKYSNCLCGMPHRYMECPYIRPRIRQPGWKPDLSILKMIKTKIEQAIGGMKITLDRILRRDADAANKEKETEKSSKSDNASIGNSSYSSFAVSSAFATGPISYKLLNCWILDCATDIHVCNDPSRFQMKRLASLEDRLRAGKTIYPIEGYGTVHIVAKGPHGPVNIQLLNVALAPGFLTNLVCLSRFTVKNVHWDTERRHLHTNGTTFCYTEPVGGHWVLENNPSPPNRSNEFAAFAAKSAMSKSDRAAIGAEWHIMLGHVGPETIAHLEKSVDGAKVIDGPPVLTTAACETCALIKAHHVVSRRPGQSESANYPLGRVGFDLISMHRAYNGDQWVSHFTCFFTHMDFVWTHLRKNDALSVIKEFVKLALIRYEQTVRFIRIDDEQILGIEYGNFMKMRGISTERTAPYTPAQNGKTERSGGVLTMKSRALRIQATLSCELWPEFYKAAGYLNNRTSKRSLDWLTPIEILIGERPKLSHFQPYGCRAYPLRHIIARKAKMEPRAMIGHLVGYDSINVFRVWVPSKMRVIRTRDVLFDPYSFYDPCVPDLGHFLSTRVEDVIQVLEMLETTFGGVLIEQDDDDSEGLIFESSSKKIDELVTELTDLQTGLKDNPTLEENQMITPEMTSDRELAVNNQIHTAVLSVPEVIEVHTAPEAAQHSSIDPIPDVQIRSGSVDPQARSGPSNPNPGRTNDSVAMNTRSRTRKQAYATALITVDQLGPYFAAFSVGLQRPDIIPAVPKLHRDDLSAEPRY
jgi:hypothetical protein